MIVGIPWKVGGRDENGVDCVGLALLAQKELCGKTYPFPHNYNPETDVFKEAELLEWLHSIAEEVSIPEVYGLVVIQLPLLGMHIGTFVAINKVLHTFPGGSSRIVPFDGMFKKRALVFFKGKGGY